MFQDNLRSLRRAAHLTQRDLAGLIGVAPSTISMYERGERLPDVAAVGKLAEALHVAPGALLGGAPQEIDDILDSLRGGLLTQEGVMFNGMPLSSDELDAVVEAMKIGARIVLQKKNGGV